MHESYRHYLCIYSFSKWTQASFWGGVVRNVFIVFFSQALFLISSFVFVIYLNSILYRKQFFSFMNSFWFIRIPVGKFSWSSVFTQTYIYKTPALCYNQKTAQYKPDLVEFTFWWRRHENKKTQRRNQYIITMWRKCYEGDQEGIVMKIIGGGHLLGWSGEASVKRWHLRWDINQEETKAGFGTGREIIL